MENIKISEECVCASGASGISNMTPQHMVATVDTRAGVLSTGGKGGKFVEPKDAAFENDSMMVHKKSNKKADAITGTGVVYAKDSKSFLKSLKEKLDSYDWDEEMYERKRSGDYETPTECCRCGADCEYEGEIIHGDVFCPSCAEHERQKYDESEKTKGKKFVETEDDVGKEKTNKKGTIGGWKKADSMSIAYDLIDEGKGDYTREDIRKELYNYPYFSDLWDAIEKEEGDLGPYTSNLVGWENAASQEQDDAAKEIYECIQEIKCGN